MSFPSASGRDALLCRNADDSSTSRKKTISGSGFGTSTPTAPLPGIGATILTEGARIAKARSAAQKRLKIALRTAALCLSILQHWAEADDNMANALLAAERTLLWGWEALRRAQLTTDKDAFREYAVLYEGYLGVISRYVTRLQTHYYARDGLSPSS